CRISRRSETFMNRADDYRQSSRSAMLVVTEIYRRGHFVQEIENGGRVTGESSSAYWRPCAVRITPHPAMGSLVELKTPSATRRDTGRSPRSRKVCACPFRL